MALQMTFKAINDSVGLEGLVPTLLVYGVYPHMTANNPLSPSVSQQAIAIKKAIVQIQKIQAKRQINNALNIRNGPSMTIIYNLALNLEVLVWREGNIGQSGS